MVHFYVQERGLDLTRKSQLKQSFRQSSLRLQYPSPQEHDVMSFPCLDSSILVLIGTLELRLLLL